MAPDSYVCVGGAPASDSQVLQNFTTPLTYLDVLVFSIKQAQVQACVLGGYSIAHFERLCGYVYLCPVHWVF